MKRLLRPLAALVVALLLIGMCFVGGLLMKLPFFRAFNTKTESVIIFFFPQYHTFKGDVDEKIAEIGRKEKG